MGQYASAAYCRSNYNSPGDQIKCNDDSCPLVQAANATSIIEYNRYACVEIHGLTQRLISFQRTCNRRYGLRCSGPHKPAHCRLFPRELLHRKLDHQSRLQSCLDGPLFRVYRAPWLLAVLARLALRRRTSCAVPLRRKPYLSGCNNWSFFGRSDRDPRRGGHAKLRLCSEALHLWRTTRV